MTTRLERLHGGRVLGWRAILGLLLVPLTAAGVLLWGLWNPTDRLETVTAAVVNLDEPVTIDGQTVPMGRLLAGELVGGDADSNFTWVLTDEIDGAAGLEDGRYASVVTIPENFSSAATAVSVEIASAAASTEEPEAATIEIRTSDRGRLLDAALSNIVITTATAVLNEQLGVQYVSNIFVGMTALGEGMSEAADGATQLATGGAQLADGAADVASGTSELATGTSELAAGIGQLASGAGELTSGAHGLSAGASELASGAQAAATGGAELASGVEGYVGGINGIISEVTTAGSELYGELTRVYAEIEDGTIPIADPVTQERILAGIREVQGELESAGAELSALQSGGTALAAGVRASANGQQELASGLAGYASGVAQFSSGVEQLALGASSAASGAGQLAAGTAELANGTEQLADGTQQAADGTRSLAEGLQTAVDEVPNFTKEQSERLASSMVRPVEAVGDDDELFNASGVPLFAGIALWAGALASFLVLAPLWRRTRDAARGVGFITLRSALPAAAIGAAQGTIAGAILPLLLGYSLAQWLGFFALSVVAGISFALVNQGLSALFGGVGRFISFALLAVAFAIGVVSTSPPVLQAIGDASPVGALFAGFQSVAVGAAGSGGAILALVLWGIGGLVLTAFAVVRARKGTVRT